MSDREIVLVLSADEAEGIADILSMQWHDRGWREFEALADVEYDDGYGAPEVATDLEIRFQDGTHFVRAEYDGSERWDAVIPRVNPESSTKPITRLTVTPREIGWATLAEMAKADGAEVEW